MATENIPGLMEAITKANGRRIKSRGSEFTFGRMVDHIKVVVYNI